MVLSLFRKSHATEHVYAVYAAIVAQSRQAHFYADWGVPDTVTGRFDMISLHLALLFRRLKGEGAAARRFSQAVFDLFFKDMDQSLREMGAGDLAVPKKIQKMGNLFYGMLTKLDEALATGEVAEIEAVLVRNVFADAAPTGALPLAEYLANQSRRLASESAEALMGGRLGTGAAA